MNAFQVMDRYRKEVIQVSTRKPDINVQYLYDTYSNLETVLNRSCYACFSITIFFLQDLAMYMMLRVHSRDLHDHLVQEVGQCLETGLYTDLVIRCKGGQDIHAHKLILSSVSPFLKWVSLW